MRAFLCAFRSFTLAIPMYEVSSLMVYSEEAVQTDTRNNYISLLQLFNLPAETIRHGIILKNNNIPESKTILLTTAVECETEIPDKEIYPMPKILEGRQFFPLFSGIQFNSRMASNTTGGLVLLLNTQFFMNDRQKGEAT